jgi:hypothetical protein
VSATPAERSLIAQSGAHKSWANTPDPSARTAPGRKAALERFEREVDPDGKLAPAERARRAEHARKAHFAMMAARSLQVRRAKAAARRAAQAAGNEREPGPSDAA